MYMLVDKSRVSALEGCFFDEEMRERRRWMVGTGNKKGIDDERGSL
jgi:hypothetical protein